jgi:DNA-3-methyladenine glycosylase II
MRAAGVSSQKAKYLLSLATMVRDGELPLKSLGRLSDEDVIARLVKVKGIGVWTAQMFLIFSLGRPDVFPSDDLGIRQAIRTLYGLAALPDKATSLRIAEPWRPYASIASWYCWQSLRLARMKQ